VKIGDNVAFSIPNKTGTGALRYLVEIQCEQITLNADRGNIDDRWRCLFKEPMVDLSSDQSSPRGETARGAAFGSFNVALSTQGCRVSKNTSDEIAMAATMRAQGRVRHHEAYCPSCSPFAELSFNQSLNLETGKLVVKRLTGRRTMLRFHSEKLTPT
jgi:hypothetical protein